MQKYHTRYGTPVSTRHKCVTWQVLLKQGNNC
ncbi:hypothetical protein CsSME_00052353 [Camellia sinensis var. sinensis]